jgi:hypothetical protein
MNEMEEIKNSIERYFKYVWSWENKEIDKIKIKFHEDFPEFIQNLTLNILPTLIVGAEPDFRLKDDYEDTEDYLKKISKWKLFYELFREYIGYVSCPFKPELMWITKKENQKPCN